MKIWPDIFKLLPAIGCSLILTTVHAQESSLRQALGSSVNIMEQHTRAETAGLKVVSVAESRRYAFKTTDRIAGYPVIGKSITLNKKKSQQLVTLLLDQNNYANIRQRCQNKYFHGIRFSKEQQKVEVAIGIPCNQVLVAFRDGKETKWWGSTLGKEAMKQVLELLPE